MEILLGDHPNTCFKKTHKGNLKLNKVKTRPPKPADAQTHDDVFVHSILHEFDWPIGSDLESAFFPHQLACMNVSMLPIPRVRNWISFITYQFDIEINVAHPATQRRKTAVVRTILCIALTRGGGILGHAKASTKGHHNEASEV